jgi:hypothetical protein
MPKGARFVPPPLPPLPPDKATSRAQREREAKERVGGLLAWLRTLPQECRPASSQDGEQEDQRGGERAEPRLAEESTDQCQHQCDVNEPKRERDAADPGAES